jgi:hypothetical protein
MQVLPGSLFGSEHPVSVFAPRARAGTDESPKTFTKNGPAHMWLPQPNDPATGRYFTHEARLTLFEGILARLHELPGVTSSAIVQRLPLESFRGAATVTIDGRIGDATEQLPTVQTNIVSAEYFETMRIPVLKGSVFTRAHDARGAPVVVINEEVARRYLGGMDPIGARIRFGGPK